MPLLQLSLLVVANLAACDVVWGVSGEPTACELRSFADRDETDMTTGGDQFTVAADKSLAVFEDKSVLFERSLVDNNPVKLDLGIYPALAVAIAPEGDLLFHSAAIEPPLLQVATRVDGVWTPSDLKAPKGVIAGVPSALVYGPRRVLVRTRYSGPEIQEYEDDGETWQPIGPPQLAPNGDAPNLTENALTMVFADVDPASGATVMFAASRSSRDEWFGTPFPLRTLEVPINTRISGQLIGNKTCDTLFVSQPNAFARYDQ